MNFDKLRSYSIRLLCKIFAVMPDSDLPKKCSTLAPRLILRSRLVEVPQTHMYSSTFLNSTHFACTSFQRNAIVFDQLQRSSGESRTPLRSGSYRETRRIRYCKINDPIRGLPTCQGNSYLFANSDSTMQFPCEWALACTF